MVFPHQPRELINGTIFEKKKRVFVDVTRISTLKIGCPVLFWLGPKFNDKYPLKGERRKDTGERWSCEDMRQRLKLHRHQRETEATTANRS